MPKKQVEKRIKFQVELYARGKTRLPSVSIIDASDDEDGIPDVIIEGEFYDFLKKFCKKLVDAGEI